jgi:hypothetical protein
MAKTDDVMAKLDRMFTSAPQSKPPTLSDRTRKPTGNGDQRTSED